MAAKSKGGKKGGKSSKKDDGRLVLASNRRARRNYVIDTVLEAGLILKGSEVKSLRSQTPTITDGFARLHGNELWLYGVHIHPLAQASYQNHEPTRRRQCLIHKRELRKLETLLKDTGVTCVALSMYFKKQHVKVELGIGRGRRKADKRQHEREKEDRKRIRTVR
jgi:SsrA-binding protein